MKNRTEPIQNCLDFLCPFEDNLHLVMISEDPLDKNSTTQLAQCLKIVRNSFLDLNKPNCIQVTTPELFRGKAHNELKNDNCVVYLHSDTATNIIKFFTNSLTDEVESMLIHKYILQAPQDKYLFNIEFTEDDTILDLIKNLDKNNTSFQYLMSYPYLALWVLHMDEFTLIQDN